MIKKHLGLIAAFFRASAISDLEYRLNIIGKIGTDIIWYAAQLSVFEVLFRQTSSIAGWTIVTTRVFMGCLFFIDSVWMLIFQENLDKFSDKVRKGELDLLLAKPVNSQFILSFQRFSTPYILNIFITTTYLIFALSHIPEVQWWKLVFMIPALPCALGVIYGVRFFFSASAVIFTRAENLNYVWYQLYRLGTRPDAVYPAWLRYAIFTVIPVAFIASVPARFLLEPPSFTLLIGAVVASTVSVYASTRYWRFALRFYASASS